MRTTWQHTASVPELYTAMTFQFIKESSLSRFSINKTLEKKKNESYLQKNALINYKLKLDISNDNICQGLLFVHSQSTTILTKIAKMATESLFGVCTFGLHSSPCQSTSLRAQVYCWVLAHTWSQPRVPAAPWPSPRTLYPEFSPSWKVMAILNEWLSSLLKPIMNLISRKTKQRNMDMKQQMHIPSPTYLTLKLLWWRPGRSPTFFILSQQLSKTRAQTLSERIFLTVHNPLAHWSTQLPDKTSFVTWLELWANF